MATDIAQYQFVHLNPLHGHSGLHSHTGLAGRNDHPSGREPIRVEPMKFLPANLPQNPAKQRKSRTLPANVMLLSHLFSTPRQGERG
jgi:hypothetical protein